MSSCFIGEAVNITFNFGHVVVPTNVIYGIAYNTTHYGFHPIGESTACYTSSGGCGYDTLDLALSHQEPPSPNVGTDPNPGTVYQDAAYGSDYCDGGTAGVNVFRLDSPSVPSCWSVGSPGTAPYYIPTVQFNTVASTAPSITSANHAAGTIGKEFSFTVTTTGVPTPSLGLTGKVPGGLTFVKHAAGTATISGKPKASDPVVNHFTLTAKSGRGKASQKFTLSLS